MCPWCNESDHDAFDTDVDDEFVIQFCICLKCEKEFTVTYKFHKVEKYVS